MTEVLKGAACVTADDAADLLYVDTRGVWHHSANGIVARCGSGGFVSDLGRWRPPVRLDHDVAALPADQVDAIPPTDRCGERGCAQRWP